jgi:choloylglycine hydrolase
MNKSIHALALAVVLAMDGDTVLAANNEDFYMDVDPKVWVTPPNSDEHGRVCLGFQSDKQDPFAQGGMNDKGLFFDVAVTPEGNTTRIKDKKKTPRNLGDRMLAECATVVEALE